MKMDCMRMDRKESVTVGTRTLFAAGFDPAGYDLAEGAGAPARGLADMLYGPSPRIRRNGASLRFYSPDAEVPEGRPLHRFFVECGTGPRGTLTPDDALAFVRRFGFVTAEPQALEESAAEATQFHARLRGLADGADRKPMTVSKSPRDKYGRDAAALAEFFNSVAVPAAVRFEIDAGDPKKPILRARPLTLGAWMLLRFAQEYTGALRYRACDNCGKLMEIGSGKGVWKARFCSDVCRAEHWRKHQAKGKSK
jgi:hypothetical protein